MVGHRLFRFVPQLGLPLFAWLLDCYYFLWEAVCLLAWKHSGWTDGLRRCPVRVEVSGPPLTLPTLLSQLVFFFFFRHPDPTRAMVFNLCNAVTL